MSFSEISTLVLLNVLFFIVVLTYYLVGLDKRNFRRYTSFIVGTWKRAGKTPEGMPWEISYTFDKNTFRIQAEPSFNVQGKYKIVREIENLLILELYQITGDGNTNPHKIGIGIDHKAKEITIDNRTFKHIG